jgi:hypothetical protein
MVFRVVIVVIGVVVECRAVNSGEEEISATSASILRTVVLCVGAGS